METEEVPEMSRAQALKATLSATPTAGSKEIKQSPSVEFVTFMRADIVWKP
jgi:hypothetical protein